ncbi:MAG TPA: iron ABC transporter permease [Stellaceae bacterium]|nr:iron ABC transporter permease [Stellaceae bacterium]
MTAETLPARRPRIRIDAQHVVFLVLLAIAALFVLYPVLVILVNSFIAGSIGQARYWSLAGWHAALTDPSMMGAIWNSVKVLAANESISLPTAIMLAWLLARTDLPGRNGLEFMFWVTFFLPSLSVTLGWVVLLDPQNGLLNRLAMKLPFVTKPPFNIYSFWGIVWAHLSTASLSIKVMLLTPVFRNLDAAFEEAARCSGAGRWQTLTRIVIPAVAPGIATVLVLSVIRAMQTFEIEMVLGPPFNFWVFGTKIYILVAQVPPEFAPATALAVIAFALITPLIFLHRWLMTRTDYTSVTGRARTHPMALGRLRWPLFAAVALLAVSITVLPVAFLATASVMKLFGFFDIAEPWTLSHWHSVLTGDFFVQSLLNTVELAGGGAVVSIVLCSLIAYFTVRSRYRGRGLLDFLSWLPFAIPGILLGVGLLYVFLGNPLLRLMYGGIPLMILATVIASMTLGVQILKSTMVQLGAALEEAARTSGASWWYAFRHVIVPILMPTLVMVGVVNFIAAARDIASVALLATNATKTLALLQLDYMIDGRSEAAAVVSVVVILFTTGVAFLARSVGLRIGFRG